MNIPEHTGPWSTTFEVAEARPKVALIGIGAFEQHSKHLPLDTDHILADRLSSAVAKRLGAMLLPPMAYSSSLEHLGFAGTVTLSPQTVISLVRDIADSIARFGIRYLVLLNCHGGNFILNPAAREWNLKGGTPRIAIVDGYALPEGRREGEIHAGEDETSILLHLAPETVHLDRAENFMPNAARSDLTHFGVKGISPIGVWGYPTRATAERGRELHEQAVMKSVEIIESIISRFEELDPETDEDKANTDEKDDR